MDDASEATVVSGGRDADRSRRLILDAAQWLFAERGYADTSMEEVGRAAGVSRGTPGYFFGSKEGLYRAVLDRVIVTRREAMEAIAADAVRVSQPPAETIVSFIVAYFDFLSSDSTFLRLIDRESLSPTPRVYDTDTQVQNLLAAIERLEKELRRGGYTCDPRHLLLSALGLCEWPFVHRPLVAAVGFATSDPGFLEARRRHVAAVIRAWLAADLEAERSDGAAGPGNGAAGPGNGAAAPTRP